LRTIVGLLVAFLLSAPAAFAAGGPTTGAPSQRAGAMSEIPGPVAFALFILGAGVVGAAVRRRKR
jgi:hypothetical protein